MKVTNKLKEEVTALMNDYWNAYFSGDIEHWRNYLVDDYRNIGGTEEEIWNSKQEILDYTYRVIDQMAGKADIRNKTTELISYDPYIMVHEFMDLYIKLEDEWTFYGKFRLSSLIQKINGEWKVLHQHGSYPDSHTEEGEAFAFDKLRSENTQLREAVTRRTIELENKNRELAIEAALERIRIRTLLMKDSNELAETATILFNEFKKLDYLPQKARPYFSLVNKENKTAIVWITKEDGSVRPGSHYVPFNSYKPLIELYEAVEQQKSIHVRDLSGEGLNNYLLFLSKLPHVQHDEALSKLITSPPERMVFTDAIHTYGTIGIMAFEPVTQNVQDSLIRFAKVFEFTYTRFLDLQKAEAQTREARIEAAVERVRAKALAMRYSKEILGVAVSVLDAMVGLDIPGVSAATIYLQQDNGSIRVWDITELLESEEGPYLNLDFVFRLEEIDPKLWVHRIWNSTDKYFVAEMDKDDISRCETWLRSFDVENADNYLNFIETAKIDHFWQPTIQLESGRMNVDFLLPPPPEMEIILPKMGAAFDLAYKRFRDLQKAEAQAREAKIEVALEKVRSRTMGMQHSDHLRDVIGVIGHQLHDLGLYFDYVNFVVGDTTEGFDTWNVSFGHADPVRFFIPNLDNRLFHELAKARAEKLEFNSFTMTANETHQFIKHLITNTILKYLPEEQLQKRLQSKGMSVSTAILNEVYLTMANYSAIPYTDEENSILKRFGFAFQQAFTRFLDLQKVEEQARETQVQLSLERVRARTMAMQESDELPGAAILLFQQMQTLDIEALSVGYCIWDEDNQGLTLWMSNGGVMQPSFHTDLSGDPSFKHIREAYERGESFYVEQVGGEELTRHYQYMRSLPVIGEVLSSIIDAGHTLPASQVFHCAYFSKGFLMFITYEPVPESHEIFKRFGKVFDQTYTRFLDLQKAEVQAREAQIEAALERVRSRTIGMHKSEELRDVIQMVFEQLRLFDFKIDSAHFNLNYKESDDYNLWTAAPGQPYPVKTYIPHFDHPVFTIAKQAKENGLDFYTESYTQEEKNKFFEHLFANAPHIPEERRKYILSGRGVAASTVLLDNISLWIMNYSGIPYSASENAILKRFGKIFEQSHIRFLDLQKAEAQARETIKQASLDRIRAEIASMRTTGDLERITPLIWNELTKLGVRFIRCGVFIMDDVQQIAHTYLSTPDGKAVAAFDLPYNSPGVVPHIVSQWQKKNIYTEYWDEQAYTEFASTLVQKGVFTSPDQYFSKLPGGGFYLHFAPFLQGMLYVGNTVPLPGEEINLIQSVANAFSTAYARYEDFNKLEAAKQQVDKTLLDLKQAQQQLIQAEKMASLGQLTAGIAHEIQNPLNFINNFSEVNRELITEMQEEIIKGQINEVKAIANAIEDNSRKINHHGKRADAIVKGMLQHSRMNSGKNEPTDINALTDEYLRLAYHGLRAKDKDFNATLHTDYDNSISSINIIPQDIGRVILNLITNAFYAANEKKKLSNESYKPTVSVRTKRSDDKISIVVEDNGNGIPANVADKIFQPFFTTKPTGEGTGLGLSLAYDIVKAHGGELKMETQEGEGTEFFISLPNR